MSGKFAMKVMAGRLGSNGAKLFFSIGIGYSDADGKFVGALSIRDCVLRESRDGKDYVAFPSKPRTKRGDAPGTLVIQKDSNNPTKDQYDQLVDLYFEKPAGAEKGSPTEAAWAVRKEVIEQAQALYGQLSSGNSGRGTAAPAGVATSTGGRAAPDIFGDDDIDLPF